MMNPINRSATRTPAGRPELDRLRSQGVSTTPGRVLVMVSASRSVGGQDWDGPHRWVGRLLLGHTARGQVEVGSTGHYQDSITVDASAGLLDQTPLKFQVVWEMFEGLAGNLTFETPHDLWSVESFVGHAHNTGARAGETGCRVHDALLVPTLVHGHRASQPDASRQPRLFSSCVRPLRRFPDKQWPRGRRQTTSPGTEAPHAPHGLPRSRHPFRTDRRDGF